MWRQPLSLRARAKARHVIRTLTNLLPGAHPASRAAPRYHMACHNMATVYVLPLRSTSSRAGYARCLRGALACQTQLKHRALLRYTCAAYTLSSWRHIFRCPRHYSAYLPSRAVSKDTCLRRGQTREGKKAAWRSIAVLIA